MLAARNLPLEEQLQQQRHLDITPVPEQYSFILNDFQAGTLWNMREVLCKQRDAIFLPPSMEQKDLVPWMQNVARITGQIQMIEELLSLSAQTLLESPEGNTY